MKNFEVMLSNDSGSSGQCKKVRRKSDGKIFACKQIDCRMMEDSEIMMLKKEVLAIGNISHPYILSYIGQFMEDKIMYIVTEYCVGGDLAGLVKQHKKKGTSISESFIWKVLWEMLFALWHCHEMSKSTRGTITLHRDVKPATVFLTETGDIKLGDFGLTRMLPSDSAFAQKYLGTTCFMSPEFLEDRTHSPKSDIWGCGCLIYQLCALTPPFYGLHLHTKILVGKFKRIPHNYSNELESVIRKMLTLQADKRPSADVILKLPEVTTGCKLAKGKENELVKKEKKLESKPLKDLQKSLQAKKKDSMASSQNSSNCSRNAYHQTNALE